jgi:uncharacterized protein YdiU (UPF0061 family)
MQLFHKYAEELADICTPVAPFPVLRARVALVNNKLAETLNIPADELSTEKLLPSLFSDDGELQAHSVAQKYGGHQFGQWNPQLGDGRGLLLGEVKTEAGQFFDLHLKGAGPTPYSRHADGRAVLRSTIREYLAGEALHALGIPSSRSLCLITSDEPVIRETRERGAMMIRVCESHLRFGHFEYYFHTDQHEQLQNLFTFAFEHHFADTIATHPEQSPHAAMLQEIVSSTAAMIAKWQAYGFNHGVMNTDNMSIHGITFDFGPYAFLDDFIPNYVCNRSDHSGRYAFDQQPSIGLWNLNALAHAFSPYLDIKEIKAILMTYEETLVNDYQALIRQRLGLSMQADTQDKMNQNDEQKLSHEIDVLIGEWMQILQTEKADMHVAFRALSKHLLSIRDNNYNALSDSFIQADRVRSWCVNYQEIQQALLDLNQKDWEKIQQEMLGVNPKYVLRNHLAQEAIAAAEDDDFSLCEAFLTVLSSPFEEHPDYERFSKPPAAQDKGIALSCSS